jgi:hypothetical protein
MAAGARRRRLIGYARWTMEQKDALGETEQEGADIETEGADANVAPTMDGFTWTPRDLEPWGLEGDRWCVRDAYCALFGWPPGSDEWNRFIEGPATEDMQPLADHLEAETFDVRSAAGWNAIIPKVDHPGVAVFEFPQLKISHMVYVGHVRVLLEQWPYGKDSHPYGYWPLTPEYLRHNPILRLVLVNLRQSPRPVP